MSWAACKKLNFTDREVEVAELVARGYTNSRIARELTVTSPTIKRHVQNVTGKLSLHRDAGMVRRVLVVERLRQMGLGRKNP